jgi:lysophospholipase L1-like esterase
MADAVARHVLVLGDSISNWVGGFIDLSTHTTYDAAIAGTQTATWISESYFQTNAGSVLQANPAIDVVHIMLMTNDAATGKDPNSIVPNLKTIIGYIRAIRPKIEILIGIPPRFAHLSGLSAINLQMNLMKLKVREWVSSDPTIRLGTDWPAFSADWVFEGYLWDDFTHPSVAGHTIATPFFDEVVAIPKKPVVAIGAGSTDLAGKNYTFYKLPYDGTKTPFKVPHKTSSAAAVLPTSGAPTVTLGDRDSDLDKTVVLASGSPAAEVTVVTVQG